MAHDKPLDTKKKRSLWVTLVVGAFKFAWASLVVLVPLLGVWAASSIAAYLNGPLAVALVAGLLAFPVLPLLWEGWAYRRHRRRTKAREAKGQEARERFLKFSDRMILRTLVINLVLLGALLMTFPRVGFEALATRGDWMLSGQEEPWAEKTRAGLFTAAEGLEWLYNATRDDPYAQFKPTPDPDHPEPPVIKEDKPWKQDRPEAREDPKLREDPDRREDPDAPEVPAKRPEAGDASSDGAGWPFDAKLHPLVTSMPASAEQSPRSVAMYIKQRARNPHDRVRALHDYVADRIAYDAAGLVDGSYTRKQDVETVFRDRKAVCAGYARLMVELGEHTGDSIVYISGVSRNMEDGVSGGGHAWNAVEIEGRWYLMDVTWNSGTVSGSTFTQKFRTDYFLTPPEVFGVDHFPNEPRWQLRAEPLSRGAWMRQPMLRPAFYAQGFTLLSPKRSQVSVRDHVTITLTNPRRRAVMAKLLPRGGGGEERSCDVAVARTTEIRCDVPDPGDWSVRFYTQRNASDRYYWDVGQIEVNRR